MSKIPTVKDNRPKINLALIDGDIFRYEIGSIKADHPMIPGEKIPAPTDMIERIIRERIDGIMEATGADDYLLFLTGKGNFRFDIATLAPYKGNRKDSEKPFHWETVDIYLRKHYHPKEALGNEADDALAIEQRRCIGSGFTTAICSRDKDLRTCEGYHYSWSCGSNQPEKPLYYIERAEGIKFFFKQMLTGDSTDNILGCGKKEILVYKSGKKAGQEYEKRKGVGPAAADKLLSKGKCPDDWYNIVRDQYKVVFGLDADNAMLENARLLYIGQTHDELFDWGWLSIKPYNHDAPATGIADEVVKEVYKEVPVEIFEPEEVTEEVSDIFEEEKVDEEVPDPFSAETPVETEDVSDLF